MKAKIKAILICLLATTCVASNQMFSLAQAQNSVGGGANSASVNLTASVLGVPANASAPSFAPVTLSPQGGSVTNQVASASVALGIPEAITVLSTGLIVNSASGAVNQTSAHAESSSTVNSVSILDGLITAATIRSKSTSDGNGASATSTGEGSFANQLRIAGVLYEQSEFAPNTTVAVSANINAIVGGLPVSVPVSGTVIINEQTGSGNGITSSALTVNFLHVNLSGSVAGLISLNADVVVASASSAVSFTLPPPTNNPPTINAPGPQTVQAGSTLTFNVSASDPDAGDTVTLQATNLPARSSFTPNPAVGNPSSGQFSFTPSESQANQTFTINFTATDSHGASVSRSVQIVVTSGPTPENRPPIISIPGPQTIAVGKTLRFIVTATDPDGDAVTLSASSIPPNASFDPATGTFTFTPTADQADQTIEVTFAATDTKGASATGAVQITVVFGPSETPGPPVISLPPSPLIVKVGDTLTFVVAAISPSPNCQVSIRASGLPNNAGFEPSSGRFNFTPTADQKDRTFVVTFTATDCINQTATGTVTIIVVDAGGGIGSPQRVCVPVTRIFFGAAPVNGGCGFVIISVANAGGRTLRVNSLTLLDGKHFRIEGASGSPILLQSGSVLQLKVIFEPKGAGMLRDKIAIITDDPENPTITIELKGKAKN
ncbi:MAG: choice-of-anchor P family protein [Acidobacteriota bacterium]